MSTEKKRSMTKTDVFSNGKYCCFTAWPDKHAPSWRPFWDEKEMDYLVYQLELSPETKRYHFQGYVEFKKSTRLQRARELLRIAADGWHAEKRKGSAFQAARYCKKAESRATPPEEFGTPPTEEHKGRGHRTDLEPVTRMIADGKSLKAIAKANPVEFIKYHKGIERLVKLTHEVKVPLPDIVLRPWQNRLLEYLERGFVKRQIIWIWSTASATGKSTTLDYIAARFGLDYVLPGSFKFVDLIHAYDEHKCIVFNIPRDHRINETDIAVLEKVSDGGVHLSPKYDSGAKVIRAVIIVFANIPPPPDALPRRVIEINIDPELVAEASV